MSRRDTGVAIERPLRGESPWEWAKEGLSWSRHAACIASPRGAVMRWCLAAGLAVGCSAEADFRTDRGTSDEGGNTFSTAPEDSASPTSSDPSAAWWSFDAVVPVEAAVPLVDGARMKVTLWADGDRRLCQHDVPVAAAAVEEAPGVEPAPLAWWRLSLGDGVSSDPECEAWASREVWIGLAPYDPRLDAEAFEEGWAGLPVYSMLVREFTDGPVWLAGLAGTVEQWDGTGSPVAAPPVSDGEYEAHALYLLELP